MNDKKIIEVCDKCKKASCWYGEFMCEENRNAGTKLVTISELKKLKYENEEYWSDEYMTKMYGEPNPFGNMLETPEEEKQRIMKECDLMQTGDKYE